MKTHNTKSGATTRTKIITKLGALLLIAPLALFVNEQLAQQNDHPSLVKHVQSLLEIAGSNPDMPDADDTNTNALEKPLPKIALQEPARVIEKLSIRAKSPIGVDSDAATHKDIATEVTSNNSVKSTEEVTPERNADALQYRSIQAQPEVQVVDAPVPESIASGDNAEGTLTLPSLSFSGDVTPALVELLIKERKAAVIALLGPKNIPFEYVVTGSQLKDGRFVALKNAESLSDRRVILPSSSQSWFTLQYGYTLMDKFPSVIELRFTRTFNHWLAEQQRAAQAASTNTLTDTTFAWAVRDQQAYVELQAE